MYVDGLTGQFIMIQNVTHYGKIWLYACMHMTTVLSLQKATYITLFST